MISLGETSVDFFDSAGIHMSLSFVYWSLFRTTLGILSVFSFFWIGKRYSLIIFM